MNRRTSLRTQVVIGAALWTLGLFIVASLAITGMVWRHPHAVRAIHGALAHGYIASAIAVLCMAAGAWSVRRGLSSIGQLRSRLSAVQRGDDARVAGAYPAEVQPVVDDLNALLDYRERITRRAIAKAGDLAHGLKTPLAVLAQEAERARRDRDSDLASQVVVQVDRMRRHVDYHLAQARAAAADRATGARCHLGEAAEGIVRTLERLHADRTLTIDVRVPPEHVVSCQREDVDEMLGNLLDNACKWARSRVVITSVLDAASVTIRIDDDGPGLRPEMREQVRRRGVRADEATAGSGLGLAIVGDLVELYGGSISLDASELGGLAVKVTLPGGRS